jgi:NAD(P)-dependent dehydrogenase (short-subunit alcohol dehydrogenase family)
VTGWTAKDIPDQTGRRAIVTGANSGLGFHTALELARHGSSVVMTARDKSKGDEAVRRVLAEVPDATVELGQLDLADLSSVREFATAYGAEPVDILVNNAGVMAIPKMETADGFEMQFGTNHLGPFALTAQLMPALLQRPGARVVTVTSFMHWFGAIDFADLMGEKRYQPWTAYGQSKLANLLFMRGLDRRARGSGLVSVAAHPGLSATNLQKVAPRMRGSFGGGWLPAATRFVGQSPAMGALPQLHAATAPGVHGGDFFGPRGPAEQRGKPKRVRMSKNARSDEAADALWARSEELTGVTYDALAT